VQPPTPLSLRATTDTRWLVLNSRYRGVSWHERSSRWEVRVWGNGRQHFVGSFLDELDAARAYDRAILKLRGQVGRRAGALLAAA
jgi:hypothetical protein